MLCLCLTVLMTLALASVCRAVRYGSSVLKEDIDWYDAREFPMTLLGVIPPTEEEPYYHRMPLGVAGAASEDVVSMCRQTAGGRVRFVTDSPFVAVHADLWHNLQYPNLNLISTAGFGVFAGREQAAEEFAGMCVAPVGAPEQRDYLTPLPEGMRRVTVYMPLYGGVKTLYIGVRRGSLVKEAPKYRVDKPAVFYGSSITQGGCASCPGNSYQGMISRSLDMDYVNLGFSGCGRGEQCVAEYIAGLDMSAFVLDYDHNAPTPEHLRATHYPFFETVRRSHPELPVIMVSRPVLRPSAEERERIAIIRESCCRAAGGGDKHVYFVDGSCFMRGYAADCWSVDGCHPNDLGFAQMAQVLENVLRQALD